MSQGAGKECTVLKEKLASIKYPLNGILSLAAIGSMVFYSVCGGSCSYLKGSILGLDLKYAGVVFMIAIIVLSLLKRDSLLVVLLSAGIGVEAFLVAFQVKNGVYCPFCLTFGALLVLMFLLNMDFSRSWVMGFFIILGFISFVIFFKGSVIPTFAVTRAGEFLFFTGAHGILLTA